MGVAIDVPELTLYSSLGKALKISVPGAATSTHLQLFVMKYNLPLGSTFATALRLSNSYDDGNEGS